MDLGLKGKVALVTACSGGMGRNIALALAAEGAHVALFARSRDKLEALAADIERLHGVHALPCPGDMREAADADRLAATLEREFGGLDVAVLNTGRAPVPLRATVDETDGERWDAAYRTQLWGAIQIAQRVHPLMGAAGPGRIIAVTSASVQQPMPHHALSTVFRAGVTAYLKHLANELGARGITVNCVAPALIETPHRTGVAAYTAEQAQARKKMNVLQRMGSQEEVCAAVVFLASRQAGFITGSTLRLDGGMVGTLF
ncbi:SDR family oxidoreductase [Pigmentiphaga soli]|uniref:SDR family oxidoreductase n=1 Tax=Pigmentiphaga soli TaxID=1007095 RepID=A0ABP8H033_9BURK